MEEGKLNILDWTSLILIFIGGLNWGLVGFFNSDVISALFGEGAVLARLIFAVVVIAALYVIIATAPKIAGMEECVNESESMRRQVGKKA